MRKWMEDRWENRFKDFEGRGIFGRVFCKYTITENNIENKIEKQQP
jgi:hypothetical protein